MRIACVLGPGFEDSEFKVPYDAFRAAGHEVTIVGLERGATMHGKKGEEEAAIEESIDEAEADDYDALFIPGGHSPDSLRADARMVAFVRGFTDKPIFAICHGPQLLVAADMVDGHRLTAWKTVQIDLRAMGADVVDEAVVVDGNLVTSRQPQDLDAFVAASLALVGEGAQHPTA
jgi:protease I